MSDLAKNIILLLTGIAVFILGMNLMSSGLKKAAGHKVRNLFDKIQNNRIAGLGIGAVTTAVIQSSAATSVMAIGFINAGVISIFQAVSIILGAHIGTTVTGLLVSLSSISGGFDINMIFILLTFVGVALSFIKNKTVKNIGEILSGLGLLFFGLYTLKTAFGYAEIKQAMQDLFAAVSNPFLLLIIGMLVTILVQSSSASTGIIITMVGAGAVDVSAAIYVGLGATIGTVFTSVIAAVGGSTNSKRTVAIILSVRIIAALLFLSIIWPLNSNYQVLSRIADLFNGNNALYVAVFMVFYNVLASFCILPFVRQLEKLSMKLMKDKNELSMKSYIKFIDDKMLNTPSIAMMQVKKEIDNMNHLACENFIRGYEIIIDKKYELESEINKTEDAIDYLNIKITDFLIALSKNADEEDLRIIGGYFHALNDIERIGDHAYNFLEDAQKMKDLGLSFSEQASNELKQMKDLILKMFEQTFEIFETSHSKKVEELHELEKQTDILQTQLSNAHYERITKNQCKPELSPFYSTLVSELERVADHLTNIGYVFTNPTGDIE